MRARTRRRRGANGFTLIELLTVILIIGVLMALVLSVARFAQYKNLETRCKADLETICTALTNYKMDIGEFPAVADWTDRLVDRGFIKEGFEFVDPWGTPYRYDYAPDSPHTFVLLSLGPDHLGDPGDADETRADNIELGKY